MDRFEAKALFAQHAPRLAMDGVHLLPSVQAYVSDEIRSNFDLAMDATFQVQPLTINNSSIPGLLTTYIDPQIVEILFAPIAATKIVSERKWGDWTMDTAMIPVVEYTGEVTSYGDFDEVGSSGVNTNFPQRQSYHFQTMKRWGERELERAGLAKINWVSSIDKAATMTLKRFENYGYFFGIQNLQNYGLLNDPNLLASLTPGVKSNGNGNVWMFNNAPNATANEVYNDILAMYTQMVAQTNGVVDEDTKFVLALSPASKPALKITNSFNVNVETLLKENFKNIRIETAPQYGQITASNPEGISGGNFMQLIAEEIEGVETAFVAYTEKLRQHPIIRGASSWKGKITGGIWGAVIRRPAGIVSMLGI